MEAQDYKKLIESLRSKFIAYDVTGNYNSAQLYKDAADAIEFLIKDRNFWKDAAIKAKEES